MSLCQNDIPKPIYIGKIKVSKKKQKEARKLAKVFVQELKMLKENKDFKRE